MQETEHHDIDFLCDNFLNISPEEDQLLLSFKESEFGETYEKTGLKRDNSQNEDIFVELKKYPKGLLNKPLIIHGNNNNIYDFIFTSANKLNETEIVPICQTTICSPLFINKTLFGNSEKEVINIMIETQHEPGKKDDFFKVSIISTEIYYQKFLLNNILRNIIKNHDSFRICNTAHEINKKDCFVCVMPDGCFIDYFAPRNGFLSDRKCSINYDPENPGSFIIPMIHELLFYGTRKNELRHTNIVNSPYYILENEYLLSQDYKLILFFNSSPRSYVSPINSIILTLASCFGILNLTEPIIEGYDPFDTLNFPTGPAFIIKINKNTGEILNFSSEELKKLLDEKLDYWIANCMSSRILVLLLQDKLSEYVTPKSMNKLRNILFDSYVDLYMNLQCDSKLIEIVDKCCYYFNKKNSNNNFPQIYLKYIINALGLLCAESCKYHIFYKQSKKYILSWKDIINNDCQNSMWKLITNNIRTTSIKSNNNNNNYLKSNISDNKHNNNITTNGFKQQSQTTPNYIRPIDIGKNICPTVDISKNKTFTPGANNNNININSKNVDISTQSDFNEFSNNIRGKSIDMIINNIRNSENNSNNSFNNSNNDNSNSIINSTLSPKLTDIDIFPLKKEISSRLNNNKNQDIIDNNNNNNEKYNISKTQQFHFSSFDDFTELSSSSPEILDINMKEYNSNGDINGVLDYNEHYSVEKDNKVLGKRTNNPTNDKDKPPIKIKKISKEQYIDNSEILNDNTSISNFNLITPHDFKKSPISSIKKSNHSISIKSPRSQPISNNISNGIIKSPLVSIKRDSSKSIKSPRSHAEKNIPLSNSSGNFSFTKNQSIKCDISTLSTTSINKSCEYNDTGEDLPILKSTITKLHNYDIKSIKNNGDIKKILENNIIENKDTLTNKTADDLLHKNKKKSPVVRKKKKKKKKSPVKKKEKEKGKFFSII